MIKRGNIGYLIASGAFFLAAIIQFINKETVLGFSFTSLGFVFVVLANNNKKPALVNFELVDKDEKFCKLLKEGNKIKAIKRCRELTNCNLKLANDYVEIKLRIC